MPSFPVQSLLALLSDGKDLTLPQLQALQLLSQERHWEPISSPFPSIDEIAPQNNPRLGLRLILFALRQNDSLLLERSKRLAQKLDLEHPSKAEQLLAAYIGGEQSTMYALKEFFASPAFLYTVEKNIYPRPLKNVGNISPKLYRHEDDKKATKALEKAYPFQGLARLISKELAERAFSIQNSANSIRVGPDQFPDLYKIFTRVVTRLGLSKVPPLYLARGSINAFTGGVEEPFVVLHAGAVSTLSPPELEFVIGHELGHIKFDHVLFHMIARMAMTQGFILSPNAILGQLLTRGMQMMIMEWSQKAELSCDRAGLLACQDPSAAMRLLLRFAGAPEDRLEDFNIDAYLAQYETYRQAADGRIGKMFDGLNKSHPWIITRIRSLQEWIDSGKYAELLDRSPAERETGTIKPLAQLCRQLTWIGVDARWIEGLQENHVASCWVLGEREHERKRLMKRTKHLSSQQFLQQNWAPLIPILPGDVVLYSLNAHALLSVTERNELQALANEPRIKVKPIIWGIEDLEEDDRKEINQRIEQFFTGLNMEYQSVLDEEKLRVWLSQQFSVGSPARPYVLDYLTENSDLLRQKSENKDFVTFHKKALASAKQVLEFEFSIIKKNYRDWFAEMDIEDRRHDGSQKLIESCERSILIANAAYWDEIPQGNTIPSLPNLDLQKRDSKINGKLVAAGVGSLGFGALLFPTAPGWLLLTGLGVGFGSMVAGQVEIRSQTQQTFEKHFAQVEEWLDTCEKHAYEHIKKAGEELIDAIKTTKETGWKSILSISNEINSTQI